MDSKICIVCKTPGPGLHRFPKDKNRLREWLELLKLQDLIRKKDYESLVYSNGRVCNSHFADWCFTRKDKKRISKNSTPNQPKPPDAVEVSPEKKDDETIPERSDVLKSGDNTECTKEVEEHEKNELSFNSELSGEKEKSSPEEEIELNFILTGENDLEWLERNLEPERIIGATKMMGKLQFLIKWKDVDEAELVDSAVFKEKFPQAMIRYYEERVVWLCEEKSII